MDKLIHILHLEDDTADAELVQATLESHGIAVEIKRVQTREEFCMALREGQYDVVLADYQLPMYDGMSALRRVQESGLEIPFIFVSGIMGEDAAIEALTEGATDYVLKLKLSRLAPAVTRALREAEDQRERKRAEEELRRVNRALRMLSDSNQALIRMTDEASLLNEVCRIVVEVGGYRMAWVGFAEHDEARTVRPAAHAGFESGYLESIKVSWGDNEHSRGPGGAAIRTGQPCIARNLPLDPAFAPWREDAIHRGYQSVIALPLACEGQTFGALGIYAADVDAFDTKEVEILKELAGDLAFGIMALHTRMARAQAETGLQLALEASRLGDWHWNIVTGEVVWSARCKALYGLPPDAEVNYDRFLSIVHPDDRQRVDTALKRAVEARSDYEVEKRVVWPDGSAHWTVSRGRVFCDANKRPLHMTGVTMDITERKQVEEALRQSERRKTILNQIAHIFLTVPDDEMYGKVLTMVIEVMRSKFGIFGFIGENGDLVIPSMTREVWNQCQVVDKSVVFPPVSWGESLWGKAVREKKSFVSDGPFHLPEGHLSIDRFLTVPILFGADTIGLISVANGDQSYTVEDLDLLESISTYISPILNARLQRDRQEQQRRMAENTLRKLSRAVDQSPASIVITDVSGNIEYVNPKFTEISGYTQAEVAGKNPRILKSGEIPSQEYERLWRTITSGKEWRGEFHNRKKNGELYWETASISPIFDSAGVITHFVAVKEDITEHKRLEQELRQAQKLEAVGQLAGGVAHDFNNILAAILMNLCMLKENPQLTPETFAGLSELEREALRAASLTRQLLLFSRRQVMEAKPLDLNEVVDNMTKMLRRLISEDIELTFQGQSAGLRVMADAGMMDQVLMNLCVNARDAMPQGGRLTVGTRRLIVDAESARMKPEAYPGVFICLSVVDTGCGMDEATLKHIFEPFFTTKEAGKGTGLGLATVYGIVNQHHGWIMVDSAPGKGTTFRVYLPALQDTEVNQAPSGKVEIHGGSETLLLVEDDQILRRFAALSLRKSGYAVLEASNGTEAVRLWEQYQARIEMLLTDMVMPAGFSGMDLAERFIKEKPSLRVVVTSGYNDEKSKSDLFAAKGIVFIAKPYDAKMLANTVRSCLDQPSDRLSER